MWAWRSCDQLFPKNSKVNYKKHVINNNIYTINNSNNSKQDKLIMPIISSKTCKWYLFVCNDKLEIWTKVWKSNKIQIWWKYFCFFNEKIFFIYLSINLHLWHCALAHNCRAIFKYLKFRLSISRNEKGTVDSVYTSRILRTGIQLSTKEFTSRHKINQRELKMKAVC